MRYVSTVKRGEINVLFLLRVSIQIKHVGYVNQQTDRQVEIVLVFA